jgi:hypothetical protein
MLESLHAGHDSMHRLNCCCTGSLLGLRIKTDESTLSFVVPRHVHRAVDSVLSCLNMHNYWHASHRQQKGVHTGLTSGRRVGLLTTNAGQCALHRQRQRSPWGIKTHTAAVEGHHRQAIQELHACRWRTLLNNHRHANFT